LIVYKATNKKNGKSYIGITRHLLEHRISTHYRTATTRIKLSHFQQALKKYPKDNFYWRVLEKGDNENIEALERYYIQFFDTLKNGYNSTSGGEIRKEYSKEARKKMSDAHKGQSSWSKGRKLPPLSAEHRAKLKILAAENRQVNMMAQKNRKQVLCIETGVIYHSLREASKELGINRACLSRVIRGIHKSAGGGYAKDGLHFAYGGRL